MSPVRTSAVPASVVPASLPAVACCWRLGLLDGSAQSDDRGSHLDQFADRDEERLDGAVVPDLDVDVRLLGFDDRHQITPVDRVADGDTPLDHPAFIHVGAE